MNAVYSCPAGNKITINIFGFKKAPITVKLRGSWYFEACIKCKLPTSSDCFLKERDVFSENRIEMDSYCELKYENME